MVGAGNHEALAHNWHHGIQRQGSVLLPRTLRKKTVEDVWKDISGATMDMGLGSESGSAPVGNSTVSKSTLVLPRQASSIARQTFIYFLTLDEFHNTLGEPGKQFGSMNMDEFLKNIWTAEESYGGSKS
ncbi:hypothetical protein L7F22_022323 [Adiantum nelumboides]|nr:hypothetical protein [Adiantum nelumboides]